MAPAAQERWKREGSLVGLCWKITQKMDDLGVPPFQETSHIIYYLFGIQQPYKAIHKPFIEMIPG